jgi:hypothetical protein
LRLLTGRLVTGCIASTAGLFAATSGLNLLVIVTVKSASFVDHPGTCTDQTLNGTLTLRTILYRCVGHTLKLFESVATAFTSIVVRRHLILRFFLLPEQSVMIRSFPKCEAMVTPSSEAIAIFIIIPLNDNITYDLHFIKVSSRQLQYLIYFSYKIYYPHILLL